MKNTLKSQLETYKRDNTQSSKEAMLSTINSISNTMDNNSATQNTIEEAKQTLTASNSNKRGIVQSVENVISSLS
ncbi:hypothetical protein K8M07_04155 [Schnuerera sp. xch1]|uniref:hypothetical protein n=1 Tax=Schnuerera sp. xch1 TaxID=2874283 RepID=UPI001CC12204|nr:hypothetical protein [Schnuerera sp. xch1]MBZ2174435.1 hypothetical protein [Schnuerera sp. xch1]